MHSVKTGSDCLVHTRILSVYHSTSCVSGLKSAATEGGNKCAGGSAFKDRFTYLVAMGLGVRLPTCKIGNGVTFSLSYYVDETRKHRRAG